MTHDELNVYRCAFCQGKIVSCNCESGFKNAIETSLRKEIVNNLRRHYLRYVKLEDWFFAAEWDHAVAVALGICDPDKCYPPLPTDENLK